MEKFDLSIFESVQNVYFVPPYMKGRQEEFIGAWSKLPYKNHIFILSSGTTSGSSVNSYAISKDKILLNARRVNEFLGSNSGDKWTCSLPYYHIGGLSIYARCWLGKNQYSVYKERWNASNFVNHIFENRSNYTSLVPTQLYDIVYSGLEAPKSLKGVFIGGDFAPAKLLSSAEQLGWPLIITYGMTEASSQIASDYYRKGHDGFMPIFDIHKISIENEIASLESESMYTAKIIFSPSSVGVLESSKSIVLADKLEVKTKDDKLFLRPRGRKDDYIKVSGRLISILDVRNELSDLISSFEMHRGIKFSSIQDVRLGHKVLVELSPKHSEQISMVVDCIMKNTSLKKDHFEVRISNNLEMTELGKFKK